jgi:hypothetical protein
MHEIEVARAELSTRTGVKLPMPPVANSTAQVPNPEVTPELRRRIEAFYAEDYEVFGSLLEAGRAA